MGDIDKKVCIVPIPTLKDGNEDPLNPLNQMFLQMATILVMSHIFYLFLKPLGQSGPVAQILAGMVLSPAFLSRVKTISQFYTKTMSTTYYRFLVFLFRVIFMFLIGLEMDFGFMKRNLRRALLIAAGGIFCCTILGLSFISLILQKLNVENGKGSFIFIYVIIVSNSASPVVYRMVSDLKVDTSDIGRLAISSSLLIEMTFIAIHFLVFSFNSGTNFRDVFLVCFSTLALIILNWYLAPWFSTWFPYKKYISKTQVLCFFVPVIVLSTFIESNELISASTMFLIGLMFPREGKAYRTLLQVLRFPVHELILPVFFGYIGHRLILPHQAEAVANKDAKREGYVDEYLILGLTVLFALGGKIIGVLAVCHFENLPWHHGIFLSFILCMKGHFGLQLLDTNTEMQTPMFKMAHDLLVSAIAIVTLISGMLTSSLLRNGEKSFAHTQTTLEFHAIETELRMLSCVYGPRHAMGAISLISALSGSQKTPFTPLLMHLVEIPKKQKSTLEYIQHEGGVKDDYGGGNDAVDINDSIDSFAKESKILIHQKKMASSLSNMCKDLCNGADGLRVSIIFLPFHKHQRIDGKIKKDSEGIRTTNQKVLSHAPCSVGIFMERSQTGFQQPHGSETVQKVATLFFGGPDDREALALSRWIITHPQVHLTLIRFFSTDMPEENKIGQASHLENEVLMSITSENTESERDGTFLEEFCNRYVSTGEAGYEEKYVDDGAQTQEILGKIGQVFSLLVVGKGRGDCPMTRGMNEWEEECPELGSVGDLLACSELGTIASVLVVQKHRRSHA